jgi:hypothetical protein
MSLAVSGNLHAEEPIAVISDAVAPLAPVNPLSLLDNRLIFHLENNTRYEVRENNFDFDNDIDSINDDEWLLNRLRLGFHYRPLDGLSFYFQMQDSHEFGSSRDDIPGALGAEGDNLFDIRQAWLEFGDGKAVPFSLKIGRQVLQYGDQRLIGPLEWSNLSRTFDAVKLRWHGPDNMWIDGIVSSVVVPERDEWDESSRQTMFSGLYAHLPQTGDQDTELYALHLSDATTGSHFVTLGTHWKSHPGALGPWDYEAEFAFQTGEAADKDLTAFATYAEAGYTFQGSWKPRIGLEYSFATGDDNALDGENRAFQNLYPTNHPHYGFMDAFSWSNIHDLALHLSAKPSKTVTVGIDWHWFWLADTNDAWRRANARTAVRPISPGADSYAGSEVDFLITWTPDPRVALTLGYSYFIAGSYLDDSGAGDDAQFFYLQSAWKF